MFHFKLRSEQRARSGRNYDIETASNSSVGHLKISTVPSPTNIPRARTAPVVAPCNHDDNRCNDQNSPPNTTKRTGSCGPFGFMRKRSAEQTEQVSRARAQELAALYETNEVNGELPGGRGLVKARSDTSNNSANALRNPKLSAHMMTPQQAAAAWHKNQAEYRLTQLKDPLLTQREREEVQRHLVEEAIAAQKVQLNLSPSSSSTRSKHAALKQEPQDPEEIGIEVVPTLSMSCSCDSYEFQESTVI